MISLTENVIVRSRKARQITDWQVWWMTPFGITPDREEAIERVRKLDMDPELTVSPIPVAIDSNGQFEIFIARQ